MNERLSQRLSEFRKFAGKKATVAVLAGSMALEACGGGTQPTQQPTIQPTETPTPTIVITPTPEVTPSPTPEPTATPTPEVTLAPSPITREGVIDDLVAYKNGTKTALNKYKIPINTDQLNAAYNDFVNSPSYSYVNIQYRDPQVFTNCENPSTQVYLRESACIALSYYAIKSAELSRDPKAIAFSQDLFSFVITDVAASDKEMIPSLTQNMQILYTNNA